jgi:hypothetical protein
MIVRRLERCKRYERLPHLRHGAVEYDERHMRIGFHELCYVQLLGWLVDTTSDVSANVVVVPHVDDEVVGVALLGFDDICEFLPWFA